MCSNLRKSPILGQLAVRYMSASPREAPVCGYSEYEVCATTLGNKLKVVSAENHSLISRIAIVFRAGARFETPENLGVTHALRIAAGLTTKSSSQFAIIRNLQEVGATLTCAADRETVSYILEGTKSAVEKSLKYLQHVATEQIFRPWEVSDNVPRIKLDLATRTPQMRAVNLLHKAAYRGRELGHSLYMSKHNIHKLSSESLQHYVNSTFTANRGAVVGLGVDHQFLTDFASCLELGFGCDQFNPAVYAGGAIRADKGGDSACVVVATEGTNLSNLKNVLASAILQRIYGTGSYIKYTNENKSPFGKLLGSSPEANHVSTFNANYSDSGLFGAMISCTSTKAGFFLESVLQILKGAKISDEDFERGKNQLKSAITCSYENGLNGIEDLANQAVLLESVSSPTQVICAVDTVTKDEVIAVAQKVANGKFTLASFGNLKCLPYLDEVK